MKYLLSLFLLLFPFFAFGKNTSGVQFSTADGGTISANLFKAGPQAVILAHGAIFNKESWKPLAEQITKEGITVLAIDFRGYGNSQPGSNVSGLEEDVLGALDFLQREGYKNISVLGASMGGGASARAAVLAKPDQIKRLILLSAVPIKTPEKIHAGLTVYIVSKKEGLARAIKEQYKRSPQPKKIFWIEGGAHAQHIFKTTQAQALTRLIINILNE